MPSKFTSNIKYTQVTTLMLVDVNWLKNTGGTENKQIHGMVVCIIQNAAHDAATVHPLNPTPERKSK